MSDERQRTATLKQRVDKFTESKYSNWPKYGCQENVDFDITIWQHRIPSQGCADHILFWRR